MSDYRAVGLSSRRTIDTHPSNTYLHSSNGSYYSIDLTIVDPSLLIDLHWSVHDVLCGSYHSLSCHILKTECTENWKFKGLRPSALIFHE